MADTTPPTLQPDFNIGKGFLVAGWIEASIAIAIVGLRTYTQSQIVGRVGIDDYLMIGALVSAVLNTSIITAAIHWGIGRHIYYLSGEQIMNAIKYEYMAQAPGIVAPTLARVSFSLYLLKFVGTSRSKSWALWFVIIGQLGFNIAQIALIFAQCKHFSSLWDNSVEGWCWSKEVQVDSGYVLGTVNCIHDLILTILPVMILKDLNMTMRIKVVLSVLMGMSIFAFAASIVKTITLGNLGKRNDFTYDTVEFIHWFTIENYVVIIAASVPALRPLLLHFKKQGTSSGNTYPHNYPMNSYANNRSRGTKGYIPYAESQDGTLINTVIVGKGEVGSLGDGKERESEEYIMPIQRPENAVNGITKTTNVSVRYERDGDVERGV